MGILDSKSRVIDAMITQAGRQHLAQGGLRIRFVSFSDASVFYAGDAASGSADASTRLYLESSNLPQDQIVVQADDAGRLLPFKSFTNYSQLSGQLLSRNVDVPSDVITGSMLTGWSMLTGSEFSSEMSGILSSSIDNFKKLGVLATFDELFGEEDFSIGPSVATFVLSDDAPIPADAAKVSNINQLESLFNDPRLSLVPNFEHLQPINSTTAMPIGSYPPWGAVIDKSTVFDNLKQELRSFSDRGYRRNFTIDPTSTGNNLMFQIFEISNEIAVKLDVIRFGTFTDADASQGKLTVFFVGKIRVDDYGSQSFIHMFTLAFE